MSTENPLLVTLRIIETLSRFDANLATLARQLNVTEATCKRHLSEARRLGADIVSCKVGGQWVYELRNWRACKDTVTKWIALTEADTVL